jgi:DNA-binding SARP family transcriptional activator/TolB-like protein
MDTLLERGITITTVGPMRLAVGGRDTALSSRKSLALLTYLALQPARTENRERAAALLWSESAPDQARGALRQTLRRLKGDLGDAGALLDADRAVLRLSAPIELDVTAALEEARLGVAPGLLAPNQPPLDTLLADLEDLDPEFTLWIRVQRERLVTELVRRLEAALAREGREADRLALAEALLRADPTHEGAARAAMQAHIALGDIGAAMRTYERLWSVLEEELDVEPSDRTQALYVGLKQGKALPAASPVEPAQDLLAPIAIVVEEAGNDRLPADFAHFGGIFRGEMIAALSRFRDWLVIDGRIDRGSPATYRAYDLRIAMHGASGSIVISMMLVDRRDGRCIWAERQTATLQTLALLQQNALRNLAVALNVHLSASRLQAAREALSPMGRAYERWIQAQALMGEWRAESEDTAERLLRDLVETAPGFVPAMVALAQILNARPIVYAGRIRDPAEVQESLALTARAVALDPLDSRAHLARSWPHAMAGSHSAALSHLDLALDLNENDPWTLFSAALGFAFAGEVKRASSLVEQARGLGMRYSRVAQGYVATTSYLIGDHAGAIEAAEVAGDAIINLPAWSAASHVAAGDEAGAGRQMALFLDLARRGWIGRGAPGHTEVIDWFMGCFPIRDAEVRALLHERLLRALAASRG